jgi:hypothetical protein
MKRTAAVISSCAALVVAAVAASPAGADPAPPFVNTVTCTTQSGELLGTLDLNPGVPPNQSHQGFVITATSFARANSIFVISTAMITIEGTTFTFIDTPPPANKTLITCTGDAGGGAILTLTGFLTPA